jgi:hypothetical protein
VLLLLFLLEFVVESVEPLLLLLLLADVAAAAAAIAASKAAVSAAATTLSTTTTTLVGGSVAAAATAAAAALDFAEDFLGDEPMFAPKRLAAAGTHKEYIGLLKLSLSLSRLNACISLMMNPTLWHQWMLLLLLLLYSSRATQKDLRRTLCVTAE